MLEPRNGAARARLRWRVVVAAFIVAPSGALADPGYTTSQRAQVALQPGVSGTTVALIASGEEVFGDIVEGIPDGIGVAPGPCGTSYLDV